MTSECVVDAELFKKYCLDSSRCNSCQEHSQCESSFVAVASCLIAKGLDKDNDWTEKRKLLCNEFWDDCAQESCEVPCERILEAEKGMH